jgi:threonine dehydratase
MRTVMPATPFAINAHLSKKYDCEVFLKREDLSPVRSYKLRGAYNFFRKVLAMPEQPEHFVCASAGNHAQGFAWTCSHFGKRGTIFMPITTPEQKVTKTRVFGGDFIDIQLIGDIFDDCYAAARLFAEEKSAAFVPPFDHEDIIEGQATVALEILKIGSEFRKGKPVDILLLPVGGGGLSAGVKQVFAELSPSTRIVLVEPEDASSLYDSLQAGERVKLKQISNFVDGAAVAQIGNANFEVLKSQNLSDIKLIPENRLCMTIAEMLNIEGVVLEPAGALTIDALADFELEELVGKRVVCVTSGGNFDFERLPEVKEKALRYSGRKKYYILRLPQRPGALKDFLAQLGPDDDISRFEYMKKSARNFGTILIGLETSGPDNFRDFEERMAANDFGFQDITDNDLLSNLIV